MKKESRKRNEMKEKNSKKDVEKRQGKRNVSQSFVWNNKED
jgi:hypothetical protein